MDSAKVTDTRQIYTGVPRGLGPKQGLWKLSKGRGLPVLSRAYRVLQGLAGSYRVLLVLAGSSGSCSVLQGLQGVVVL